jgi:hypothetical protein
MEVELEEKTEVLLDEIVAVMMRLSWRISGCPLYHHFPV